MTYVVFHAFFITHTVPDRPMTNTCSNSIPKSHTNPELNNVPFTFPEMIKLRGPPYIRRV